MKPDKFATLLSDHRVTWFRFNDHGFQISVDQIIHETAMGAILLHAEKAWVYGSVMTVILKPVK